jgi:hypothetical protein
LSEAERSGTSRGREFCQQANTFDDREIFYNKNTRRIAAYSTVLHIHRAEKNFVGDYSGGIQSHVSLLGSAEVSRNLFSEFGGFLARKRGSIPGFFQCSPKDAN